MKTWALGEVCTHGSLGRSCPICEREEKIEELREEVEVATANTIADSATVGRLRAEVARLTAELASAKLKHKEDAVQIVDLMHERDAALADRIPFAEEYAKGIATERDHWHYACVEAERRIVAMGADIGPGFAALAEERNRLAGVCRQFVSVLNRSIWQYKERCGTSFCICCGEDISWGHNGECEAKAAIDAATAALGEVKP